MKSDPGLVALPGYRVEVTRRGVPLSASRIRHFRHRIWHLGPAQPTMRRTSPLVPPSPRMPVIAVEHPISSVCPNPPSITGSRERSFHPLIPWRAGGMHSAADRCGFPPSTGKPPEGHSWPPGGRGRPHCGARVAVARWRAWDSDRRTPAARHADSRGFGRKFPRSRDRAHVPSRAGTRGCRHSSHNKAVPTNGRGCHDAEHPRVCPLRHSRGVPRICP